ncbi:Na+/H+ antiporter [Janthinobacterium psychrotolerans]|uniref:Monovalent cation:H+ antiporter, CPA1 family n=1 Tax=Janthinobacterium psychrotolerans TaxID=1747903 RepID=A0A1A7C4P9_9BURK|nr:Na+/H+ antiporter [Janthinobacterium psychrotolerans]OBV39730.1 monovalent cation:H+ antiporter, CPA1 family [Janthinobacterium psychrotolerans]
MHTVTIILVLVLTVVLCGFLARSRWIKLPLPLIQIAGGTGLALFGLQVPLDPGIFFLLFIPPLLFLDGWRIPKGAFFSDARSILMLAIGLVLFTVLGMGFFIDWLIPTVPLAVAFALGAILSPTDPVAVSAIAAGNPIPPRLMHILEGESLLNDASGLVCFTFAVGAMMTGGFSIGAASLSFLQEAGGGIVIGLAISWGVGLANKWLVSKVGEEPGLQILISILIPFAAYLGAEQIHGSGILAAATAGVSMHYADLIGRPLAATRTQRKAVWDTVQLVLNGVIFVMLGAQLPTTITSLQAASAEVGAGSAWKLPLYVVAITVGLTFMRFVWVAISMKLTLFRRQKKAEKSGMALEGKDGPNLTRPSLRLLLVASFAGVRGALTLAGILTLPLFLPDGTRFPARDLVIFLAMGVILLSLLLASVTLPLLTKGLVFSPPTRRSSEERNARAAAAEAAVTRLEKVCSGLGGDGKEQVVTEAANRLIEAYRRRMAYGESSNDEAARMQELARAERALRLEALNAERDELFRRRISGELEDAIHLRLLREIDLLEATLEE